MTASQSCDCCLPPLKTGEQNLPDEAQEVGSRCIFTHFRTVTNHWCSWSRFGFNKRKCWFCGGLHSFFAMFQLPVVASLFSQYSLSHLADFLTALLSCCSRAKWPDCRANCLSSINDRVRELIQARFGILRICGKFFCFAIVTEETKDV